MRLYTRLLARGEVPRVRTYQDESQGSRYAYPSMFTHRIPQDMWFQDVLDRLAEASPQYPYPKGLDDSVVEAARQLDQPVVVILCSNYDVVADQGGRACVFRYTCGMVGLRHDPPGFNPSSARYPTLLDWMGAGNQLCHPYNRYQVTPGGRVLRGPDPECPRCRLSHQWDRGCCFVEPWLTDVVGKNVPRD